MNSCVHDLKRSGDISDFKNVAKKPKIGPKCMKRQDKDEVKDHKKSKFVIDHKAKVLKLNLSRWDKNLEANETDKEIDKEVTKKLEIENERRKEKSRPKHKEKSESESKPTKISVENKEKERSDNESRHIKSSTDGNRKQDRKHENYSREYSDKHKHSEKPKHPHSENHVRMEFQKNLNMDNQRSINMGIQKSINMDIQKNLNMDNQISINMEIQKSIKKSKEKILKKYKNFPDKSGSKKGDDDKQIKSPKNLKSKANEEENIASKNSKHNDKTENYDEKKDSIKRPETKIISVEIKKKENKKEEKLHEPSKKLEIFSSCLVTKTSPDSDDELEDLGLQQLPENTPRYITHCDDTEFLSEDDLNSETSSVTGIMTPTFPVENTNVNKNSERDIYRKSKRMEERKKS